MQFAFLLAAVLGVAPLFGAYGVRKKLKAARRDCIDLSGNYTRIHEGAVTEIVTLSQTGCSGEVSRKYSYTVSGNVVTHVDGEIGTVSESSGLRTVVWDGGVIYAGVAALAPACADVSGLYTRNLGGVVTEVVSLRQTGCSGGFSRASGSEFKYTHSGGVVLTDTGETGLVRESGGLRTIVWGDSGAIYTTPTCIDLSGKYTRSFGDSVTDVTLTQMGCSGGSSRGFEYGISGDVLIAENGEIGRVSGSSGLRTIAWDSGPAYTAASCVDLSGDYARNLGHADAEVVTLTATGCSGVASRPTGDFEFTISGDVVTQVDGDTGLVSESSGLRIIVWGDSGAIYTSPACIDLSGKYERSPSGFVTFTQTGCSGTASRGFAYNVSGNVVTHVDGETGTISESNGLRTIVWGSGSVYTAPALEGRAP